MCPGARKGEDIFPLRSIKRDIFLSLFPGYCYDIGAREAPPLEEKENLTMCYESKHFLSHKKNKTLGTVGNLRSRTYTTFLHL